LPSIPILPLARAFARAQSGKGEAYEANVRPMAMPVVKKGDASVSIQWGHLVSFFDHGGAKLTPDSPAAAFVRHISRTETQVAYYRATGVFPATLTAQAALKDDAYLVNWIAQARNARPDEVSQFSNGAELRQIIGEEIAGAMLGQKTADAAMASRLKAAGPKK
jgi:multiple sugar transport system substrate-binding protein